MKKRTPQFIIPPPKRGARKGTHSPKKDNKVAMRSRTPPKKLNPLRLSRQKSSPPFLRHFNISGPFGMQKVKTTLKKKNVNNKSSSSPLFWDFNISSAFGFKRKKQPSKNKLHLTPPPTQKKTHTTPSQNPPMSPTI